MPTASTHITIIQCLYQVHMGNITDPGSYEKTVNLMFAANNLPPLKVPFVPKSELLITKLTEAINNSTKAAAQPTTSRAQQEEPTQAQASLVEQTQETQRAKWKQTQKNDQNVENARNKKGRKNKDH